MCIYIYISKKVRSKTQSFRGAEWGKGQVGKSFKKTFCYLFQKLGKKGSAPSFYGYCGTVEIDLF